MKILYTIDCGLNAGGAPRSTSILLDEMAKEHEIFVLMPKTEEAGNPCVHYIKLEAYEKSFPFFFTHPFKAIRLVIDVNRIVKSISPDIIHAQMPRGAWALGLLKRLGQINTPLIYTEREYVTGLRKIYQWIYAILVAKPFSLIICLSKKSIPFWLQYRNEGVVYIPNPGGKEFDVYLDTNYQDAINLIDDYNAESLNVLFVGRYLNTKRWDLVEKIIERYNEKNPSGMTHFYIAVAYDNNDREALDMVDRLVNQRNVTVYSNANVGLMSALYYVCDMHLITSSIESFGRTAIEAMSRKCVVYSTDAGAISETIGDKGLILPASADCFINVIEEYEIDRARLADLKNRLFERYQSLYTTDANYMANLKEYQKIINK